MGYARVRMTQRLLTWPNNEWSFQTHVMKGSSLLTLSGVQKLREWMAQNFRIEPNVTREENVNVMISNNILLLS